MRGFVADGGDRAVPRIDHGIGRQFVDNVAQGVRQRIRIPAGKIGTSYGAIEQNVTGKQGLFFR